MNPFDTEQSVLAGGDSGFVELGPHDFCHIDADTAKTLELVQNNSDNRNQKHTLFGYLNANTCSTTGARMLRQSILMPLYHHNTLEHRLDCVEFFIDRVDTLANVSNAIKRMAHGVDLDTLVPTLVGLTNHSRGDILKHAERKLTTIGIVQTLCTQIQTLVCHLQSRDQNPLSVYAIALEDPTFSTILDDIDRIIESNERGRKDKKEKLFRIRQGYDNIFDVTRGTYKAGVDAIESYLSELHKDHAIPWKLAYNSSRGYHLSISASQLSTNSKLPPIYINIERSRSMITCTTREMMQLNVRASVSYETSMTLANEILTELIISITRNQQLLSTAVEIIGMLDILTAFAKLVNQNGDKLVRPILSPMNTVITKSRHPVLESVLAANGLVVTPNDVSFDVGSQNFILVTGPNMGGKSVYLKQVALIQIMAQIGCYVPAESAHIKLMNRIVARCGKSDDYQSNCSSFMWEMKSASTALIEDKSITNPNVLFVIDEIGRGTSIDDGASYSFAIAEELASRRNSFTIFATHFDLVFTLANLYRNVRAYHFKCDFGIGDDSDGEKSGHTLVPGLVESDHYGLRIAKMCGLNADVLKIACKDLELEI